MLTIVRYIWGIRFLLRLLIKIKHLLTSRNIALIKILEKFECHRLVYKKNDYFYDLSNTTNAIKINEYAY